MPGSTVVTSEGLEQHPRWVPFILGTLGSSQHKQVCKGFLQKGCRGPGGCWARLTLPGPPSSQVWQGGQGSNAPVWSVCPGNWQSGPWEASPVHVAGRTSWRWSQEGSEGCAHAPGGWGCSPVGPEVWPFPLEALMRRPWWRGLASSGLCSEPHGPRGCVTALPSALPPNPSGRGAWVLARPFSQPSAQHGPCCWLSE